MLSFANPDKIGELDVNIKRGHIHVSSHDKQEVIVKLTAPDYHPDSREPSDGLSPFRPSELDFEIVGKGNRIEVDANSNRFITNLAIVVPRNINLILDSYRDGELNVTGVCGEMRVRSQNNDIKLTHVSGSARVWSYNGNLSASFDQVAPAQSLSFETYNGHVAVSLPGDIKATVKFRTGKGKVYSDFAIKLRDAAFQTTATESGGFEIKSDEFVAGVINDGGLEVRLETENGDIRLRRSPSNEATKTVTGWMNGLPGVESGVAPKSPESDGLEARRKTYAEIKRLVELDQMPDYLQHAALAGVMEMEREMAMKRLDVEAAYKLESQLRLAYEKAILSCEAMLEDPSWQQRFPAMNVRDTAPYRRRLEFLNELAAQRRKNDPQSTEASSDRTP